MSRSLLRFFMYFQTSSTAWITSPQGCWSWLFVAIVTSSLLTCLLPTKAIGGRVLQVGNGKTYALPSQAAAAAQDGDTIEIDAGVYSRDAATWKAHNLTIRGVGGGRAHMDSQGVHDQYGKGIWVVVGNNTTIENIEFSGAKVPDANGAGIRLEGVSLTLRNCYFHDNQNGLLTVSQNEPRTSDVLIEYSEFARNGFGDAETHNIYIGKLRSFTLRYSSTHDANNGQLIKSRAATNYILYNRIVDQPSGTSNYELDFSNGGVNYVIGNVIYQSVNSENHTMLTHAPEGATNPGQELYVINNTFVNSRPVTGVFLRVVSPVTTLKVLNNLFVGDGTVLFESGVAKPIPANNLQTKTPGFLDATNQNYRLVSGSPAIDKGVNPGTANNVNLLPTFQYLDHLDKQSRPVIGSALDFGAYEFGVNPPSGTVAISPPQGLQGTTSNSTINLSWGPASSIANVISGYKVFRNGALLTTVTGLTFADTSVSPTLTYTYYVKAFDSANNESVSSNVVTLATPRLVSTTVPTTPGWSQLTNTKIRPLCPPNVPGSNGCGSVVEQWSGGAFDTKRNRLIIWGGGQVSYAGNELYALNLDTLSVSRLTDPATPYESAVEALAGGTQPNSRRTYDGLAYMENVDRLFAFGGGGYFSTASNGNASLETWTFDFATNRWQWMRPAGPNPKSFISMTAYDPNTGKVLVHDGQCMYAYDFASNSYQSLPAGGTCQKVFPVGYWMTGVLDPVRKKFFLFGGGDQWVYDVSSGSSFAPQAFKTTGGEAFVNSRYPGLAYDSASGRIVGWNGGDTIYILNIDTKSWTAVPYAGGPGAASPNGTLKRWNYSPKLGVFVVLNSIDRDAFVLRLSTNPVPAAPIGLVVQ
jgi:hypothetical protein